MLLQALQAEAYGVGLPRLWANRGHSFHHHHGCGTGSGHHWLAVPLPLPLPEAQPQQAASAALPAVLRAQCER